MTATSYARVVVNFMCTVLVPNGVLAREKALAEITRLKPSAPFPVISVPFAALGGALISRSMLRELMRRRLSTLSRYPCPGETAESLGVQPFAFAFPAHTRAPRPVDSNSYSSTRWCAAVGASPSTTPSPRPSSRNLVRNFVHTRMPLVSSPQGDVGAG